jgi:hypothetical protein
MGKRDFQLTMEVKADCLHVQASGLRSPETAAAISVEVFNAALKTHLQKVSIDIRELTGDFGIMDVYTLVKDILINLTGKGVNQVAIMDIRRSVVQGWFLETVAQNRGINFRVFEEEKAATDWLGIGLDAFHRRASG